ncbi:MAG: DNA repair protein RecO [Candidatus Methanomethylophilaceae archaeon]|nr:DNA repair protein RecO [Candidatus Methanomethylophilaceae archaeon]
MAAGQVFQVAGLVLRVAEVGDSDRMLTVLTAEEGKLSVFARGAKKLNGSSLSACQPLAYALFTLRRGREYSYLRESTTKETFHALCGSLSAQALAAYFCEIAETVSYPGGEARDLLQLTLNALWVLAEGKKPEALVKASFELRAAALDGYLPDLRFCCSCGRESLPEGAVLDIMNGRLFCGDCFRKLYPVAGERGDGPETDGEGTALRPLRVSGETLQAMRYILSAPARRQFAFAVSDRAGRNLSQACEQYLFHHVGHGFPALSYYRQTGEFSRSLEAAAKKLRQNAEKPQDDGIVPDIGEEM